MRMLWGRSAMPRPLPVEVPLPEVVDVRHQRRAIKALQRAGIAVESIEGVRSLDRRMVLNVWNIGRATFEAIFGRGSWVRTVSRG